MASYRLKWGKETLNFDLPPSWHIETLLSKEARDGENGTDPVQFALDHPIKSKRLEEIVRPGERIAVLVNDMTRLWNRPSQYLRAIFERFDVAGIRDRDVFIVIATGMHRQNSPEEHRMLVGEEIYDRVPVFNHDCRDNDWLVKVEEKNAGNSFLINRRVFKADRVIATGGIVLHGLAGFSGGPKSILPGVSGIETIQRNHALALDKNFKLKKGIQKGVLRGNPLAAEMQRAARLVGVDFLLNVVVDGNGHYAAAFAGDIIEAHKAGCVSAKQLFQIPFPKKAPVVIAGVGGYPRDIELYQAVKALENATVVTREGGTILFMCHCQDGLGPDDWLSWFELGGTRDIAIKLAEEFRFPGFAALKLATFAKKYRILLVSTLPPDVVRKLHMTPFSNAENALEKLQNDHTGSCSVIFMPSAASTVPVRHRLEL